MIRNRLINFWTLFSWLCSISSWSLRYFSRGDLKYGVEPVSCNEPESCLVLFSNSRLQQVAAFPMLLAFGIHEGLILCCPLALFLCRMGAELDCSTMTVIHLHSAFSAGTPHLNIFCNKLWSETSRKVFSFSRYLILP